MSVNFQKQSITHQIGEKRSFHYPSRRKFKKSSKYCKKSSRFNLFFKNVQNLSSAFRKKWYIDVGRQDFANMTS